MWHFPIIVQGVPIQCLLPDYHPEVELMLVIALGNGCIKLLGFADWVR